MIRRNLSTAEQSWYDLVVIGGGIYGVMLCLEASRMGKSVLLLEQNDFGSATSSNSLKTIHGGLRHLQSLNLKLFHQFVVERRWFITHFSELVKPLPVLMPLYGEGLRRSSIMSGAFMLDRLLSRDRNRGLAVERQTPFGKLLSREQVATIFPGVRLTGLRGGASWYDACIPDTQRLIMEVLRRACGKGATALNYVRADGLEQENGEVRGVYARDRETGTTHVFRSNVVLNATGPWSRRMAAIFGQDIPGLYTPSLAWNILFDRPALSGHALAVSAPGSHSQLLFLHPWKGRLLAGTGHAPRNDVESNPQPTDPEVEVFLDELNSAIPGLALGNSDILHVYSGYLPALESGKVRLLKGDHIIDHSRHGGPRGMFSLTGTRFTASRMTAEKVLAMAFPNQERHRGSPQTQNGTFEPAEVGQGWNYNYDWMPVRGTNAWMKPLGKIIADESVVHLDDLILRRTTLGDNPERAIQLAPVLCRLFEWNEARCREEIGRVVVHFQSMNQLPITYES